MRKLFALAIATMLVAPAFAQTGPTFTQNVVVSANVTDYVYIPATPILMVASGASTPAGQPFAGSASYFIQTNNQALVSAAPTSWIAASGWSSPTANVDGYAAEWINQPGGTVVINAGAVADYTVSPNPSLPVFNLTISVQANN